MLILNDPDRNVAEGQPHAEPFAPGKPFRRAVSMVLAPEGRSGADATPTRRNVSDGQERSNRGRKPFDALAVRHRAAFTLDCVGLYVGSQKRVCWAR